MPRTKVTPEAAAAETWVSVRAGRRLSGKTHQYLLKQAMLGTVRFKADPGESMKLHREDCVKLAAQK